MITFWEDTDKLGITAKCEFSNEEFQVSVHKGNVIEKESFSPNFEPIFGMDVIDMNKSMEVAERLAIKLEKRLGIGG